MLSYLSWRHKTTGERYAVRVNDEDVLDGVSGTIPLMRQPE
jgi:hypothetical protein